MQSTTEPTSSLIDAQRIVREAFQRHDWQAAAAQARKLPDPLPRELVEVAANVAFALGQLQRYREAISLLEHVWAVAPAPRCAGSLAYLHYSACMELSRPGRGRPRRDRNAVAEAAPPTLQMSSGEEREAHRRGFRRWIAEALRLDPGSPKHLYRLGVFEAQLEPAHDRVALRAFLAAIESYRALDPEARARRHDLAKYHARALYAAARSALRLDEARLARRLAFACIREDGEHHYVAPVFKLGLAAKVCLATRELEAAERAVRMALDAEGPPRRDYLHSLMADILQARGEIRGALDWLEAHVRPERRPPAVWRKLGDLRRALGALDLAEHAYQVALQRDRLGRHLTFVRLAELAEQRGALGQARRFYERALEFRRRQYSSDDRSALAGLERLGSLAGEPRPLAKAQPRAESEPRLEVTAVGESNHPPSRKQ